MRSGPSPVPADVPGHRPSLRGRARGDVARAPVDGDVRRINGIIIGNYLTTLGRQPEEDLAMLDRPQDAAQEPGDLDPGFGVSRMSTRTSASTAVRRPTAITRSASSIRRASARIADAG